MLTRSGIISAVSANTFTVHIDGEKTCQGCQGCAGVKDTSLTLLTDKKNNTHYRPGLNDSVRIGLRPESLTRVTFIWFALPVLLLLGVLLSGRYFGLSEIITTVVAITLVFLFYGGLIKFCAIFSNTNLLNNLTIAGSK